VRGTLVGGGVVGSFGTLLGPEITGSWSLWVLGRFWCVVCVAAGRVRVGVLGGGVWLFLVFLRMLCLSLLWGGCGCVGVVG